MVIHEEKGLMDHYILQVINQEVHVKAFKATLDLQDAAYEFISFYQLVTNVSQYKVSGMLPRTNDVLFMDSLIQNPPINRVVYLDINSVRKYRYAFLRVIQILPCGKFHATAGLCGRMLGFKPRREKIEMRGHYIP